MDRAALYKLVVAQLADDGYHGAAQAVSQATGTPGPSVLSLPSHALHGLLSGSPKVDALAPAVSLLRSPAVAPYRPRMAESVGAHRAVVRFSADGKQLAVGTSDGLVHVLDADALLAGKGSAESAMRRFTDHAAAVNDLDYHPSGKQLVSASDDNNLHFYDVTSATAHSVPLRTCTDTHPVRSAAFHPKGDHLLVATSHAALHLYDIATFRCFLSPDGQHHQHPLTEARWAADGACFASCAAGEVKIWDGGTCRCLTTLHRPHGGTSVGSVRFSRSGRYLLTSGADSAVNLWDVRMLRGGGGGGGAKGGGGVGPAPVRVFEGATQSAARRVAAFSHDEALVLSADETTGAVVLWSSTTAEPAGRCLGHTRPVFSLAHAPTCAAFVSTDEEGALRVWAPGAVPGR